MLNFDYKPFIAIIGDIVGSKNLQDRKIVQEKLITLLNNINEQYKTYISSKFMITLGDEFQGLLHAGVCVIEIIEKIEQEMHPIKIRFGVGVGKIETNIDLNMPLGADGSAYYNARKMIDKVWANEKKKMGSKPNIGIEVDNYDDVTELMNTILSLSAVIKSKWTDRQREIINAYTRYEGTQSSVAQKLGINQSSVQKALLNAGFYAYQQALQTITKTLSQIKEKQNV
jgi:hypothetical protein